MFRAIFFLLTFALTTPAWAEAIPAASDPCERCEVKEGYYRASAPPDWDGKTPLALVVYFHAWGKAPKNVTGYKRLIEPLHRRGALVVAPFARIGYWRQIGEGRHEGGRDEAAYVKRILQDVKRRWPIDETRMLASGFSRGASLVWNLACYERGLFTAYAPFGGGFWHSTPGDCPAGPAALRHVHGLADEIVAYDEVGLYNSAPITDGVALFRRVNSSEPTAAKTTSGNLTCERWDGAQPTEICLHKGGHWFPPGWLAESFDWMIERHAKR